MSNVVTYPLGAFADGLDEARLAVDVRASAITVALDHVSTAAGQCHVTFKADVSPENAALLDAVVAAHDGTPLEPEAPLVRIDAPSTEDRRPVMAPIAFPKGFFLSIAGAGDTPWDPENPLSGRGEGTRFRLSRDTAGASSAEWQFSDPVTVIGGAGFCKGAVAGDELDFGVYAPATAVAAAAPGAGTCVLVGTGYVLDGQALMVVVPQAGGTHTVTAAVPVPASVGEPSFWRWTPAATWVGPGDLVAAPSGGWNLYTLAVPLTRQVPRMQLLDGRALSVDVGNAEPIPLLPQWRCTATLRTTTATPVHVVWEMKVARTRTTRVW